MDTKHNDQLIGECTKMSNVLSVNVLENILRPSVKKINASASDERRVLLNRVIDKLLLIHRLCSIF